MTARQRVWSALSFAAGVAVVAFPLLREVGPTWFPARSLELSRFLALELALVLTAYWSHAAAQAQRRVVESLYLGFALASAWAGLFAVWYFSTDDAVFLEPRPAVLAAATLNIVLVLIAAWRAAGKPLTLVVLAALVLGFGGQYLPEVTGIPSTPLTSHLLYLTFGSSGLYGIALDIMSNLVLAFVIFGVVFEVIGGSGVIAALALRLAAHSRSGAIKACVVASGLFGTISGAVMSNVVTSGSFSIPSMRRIGVPNATAAGIEAAASTGGQIMPPVLGAAAFLLADLVGVPYGTVVLASLGPALLIYFAFFRQADRVIRTAPAEAAGEMAEAPPGLRWAWLSYLLPVAMIVGMLMHSNALVARAAIFGTLACLPVGLLLVGPREVWSGLVKALPGLIRTATTMLIIAACVGLLLGAIYASGLTIAGAIWIGALGEANLLLALALTAGSAFLLGMGVATSGVYILGGTLLAPGLVAAGVPALAAHFFVLYCGILSMITPPVAFASIAASAFAKAPLGATSMAALRFGWMLFVMPFLIVLQPGLLMIGSGLEIVLAFVSTAAFVVLATSCVIPRLARWAGSALLLAAVLWGGDWPALGLTLSFAVFIAEALRVRAGRAAEGLPAA